MARVLPLLVLVNINVFRSISRLRAFGGERWMQRRLLFEQGLQCRRQNVCGMLVCHVCRPVVRLASAVRLYEMIHLCHVEKAGKKGCI